MRGRDGSRDTLESFVATTQLRSPPEQAGMTDARDPHRFGSGVLKGMEYQQLAGAPVAGFHMLTELGFAGIGPVAAAEDCLDFGLVGAGFHGLLRAS
jgi:hypothetical protein